MLKIRNREKKKMKKKDAKEMERKKCKSNGEKSNFHLSIKIWLRI